MAKRTVSVSVELYPEHIAYLAQVVGRGHAAGAKQTQLSKSSIVREAIDLHRRKASESREPEPEDAGR